ncbi:MAG: pantoate--beta-alanine ligase [Candidatus Omnitrophica bacterium]|nr:pantoate--beta-alanine ligase [Candidatus Omnitrophota bacterium]MDD5512628.1 pantoate--beta-alanine ligase [Candidatus Omnitrophota bacterium]
MKIVRSVNRMFKISSAARRAGRRIGFVPTMGALHQGHLSLIRAARRENDLVVVSIFVNPLQFGPKEDFKKYPRAFSRDKRLCRDEKVDFVFSPPADEIYPEDFKTAVLVKGLSDLLCGSSRPGHFQGVATVVSKLFNIVSADTAYFGQKDAQQTVIIRQMVRDLNIPVKIRVMPIVREKDGLAMSSRNIYLSSRERQDARVLPEALKLAKVLMQSGQQDSRVLINRMRKLILRKKNAKIDYIAVVDGKTLRPLKKVSSGCLILAAVFFGRTRLIDNLIAA